jgi:phosphatidylglycerophosphate synthase
MRTVGLLFSASETPASLVVGGITVLERQARQLRRAGIETLLACEIEPLTELPAGVEMLPLAKLGDRIAPGDRVLAIAPGVVVDERAIVAVLEARKLTMLVAADRDAAGTGVERLDSATFAAGVMTVPAAMVLDVAGRLGDWNFASTLLRAAAADPAVARLDIAAIPTYSPARRRDVTLFWAQPQTIEGAAAATDGLIAGAQKGCLDWPARFIHPAIEDLLVRMLAPTTITPNMVTLATGFVGIAAGFAFAHGLMWLGLVLALVTGPLDGVDGKLARTRVEFSKWGDLEHVLDKLLEYGWYLCIAGHFAAATGGALPWAIAALIILPALVEAVQGEVFRRMTRIQLDDAGQPERMIRMFAGRRNTFLWTWLPVAAMGYWFEGFVTLSVYSVLTTVVAQWRFYKRLAAYGRDHGAMIAANLRATGYQFLPPGDASSK